MQVAHVDGQSAHTLIFIIIEILCTNATGVLRKASCILVGIA